MEKILQSYLRRLTNLSGNNRSLLLLRLLKEQFMDIQDLNYAMVDQPSFSIIEKLIAGDSKMPICHEMDSRDETSNVLSKRLKKIQRMEKFLFHERGAKDLYVGWPFVQGKFADGTLIRCPLIFFPVELSLDNGTWSLIRRKDVNTTLNKTFLLAYAYYNEVTLDEELIEQVIDDYDSDSTHFRTQLYELLKSSKVELNFNQENFTDQLRPFIDLRKEQLESSEKAGQLKMQPEAVLGIFPQAGSYLVPDYVQLIERHGKSELGDFFSHADESISTRVSDRVKEENTFTPFRIDAFQEHALAQIKKGQSLVIQGPPGSGKSQLISNLISDFIARGKNVLLVCQKRAALDVVEDRLRSKGLTDFLGLVHDFKNDRKAIFEKINRQIESLPDYELQNNGLDAIYLERQFQQASRKIDQITEELDEFKEALYSEVDCGKSAKELYLISSPDHPSVTLNQEYREFHYNDIPDFLTLLSRYLDYYEPFESQPHFWAQGLSFAEFKVEDLQKIKSILSEIPKFQTWIDDHAKTFTKQKIDYETLIHFTQTREKFDDLLEVLSDDQVFKNFIQIISLNPSNTLETLQKYEQGILQCFKGAGPEISLPHDQLGRFQEALESAIKARKGLFSWLKWKLTSKDKTFVMRVMVANELRSDRESFEVLLDRIDNRLNFEHLLSEIQQIEWMKDFPRQIRKIDIQNWFFILKEAVRAFLARNAIRSLPEYIAAPEYELDTYKERIKALADMLDLVPEKINHWKGHLSENQIRMLMMGRQDGAEAAKLLKKDFDSLIEYHKLRDGLSNVQKDVLRKLTEDYLSKDHALKLFQNSIALAWIAHLEAKFPVLRAVSSKKLEQLIADLQESNREKRIISRDILLLKSRERTYSNVEYNRLNNRVTYRDIQHQVTKKRRIWPIRRVVSAYADELFQLIPCWMASPESVSAIFPMERLFDLVIFDEASQCFSERGLPAIFRGRQIVVAGDSKQLKPNDLYLVRWEEQEADTPELEIDSLLDLTRQYIPEVQLLGHYRSQSFELIEFSNEHFYEGKLRLIPHFKVANAREPSIHYVKTDGVWDNNTNEIEGQEVVKIASKLLQNQPEKSIGIVTFNTRQQQLIQDMMEYIARKKDFLIPENLFIKNIENVQGDERDVIIFSTAYAKDKKGKLRLQFGSLNQDGGENRLNVAVTRAKEEVYLVTSIHPSELQVDDTKNPGPKLLKAYLEYAHTISKRKWNPPDGLDESRGQEWYLRNQLPQLLKSDDFKLTKNLPFADLTLMKGKEYRGLIYTDDDLYFNTLSAKQAHAYQVSNLAEKKWPNVRFYSREYWMDRSLVIDRLEKFLSRAGED